MNSNALCSICVDDFVPAAAIPWSFAGEPNRASLVERALAAAFGGEAPDATLLAECAAIKAEASSRREPRFVLRPPGPAMFI